MRLVAFGRFTARTEISGRRVLILATSPGVRQSEATVPLFSRSQRTLSFETGPILDPKSLAAQAICNHANVDEVRGIKAQAITSAAGYSAAEACAGRSLSHFEGSSPWP